MEKWGYEEIIYRQVNWIETFNSLPSDRYLIEKLAKNLIMHLPVSQQATVTIIRNLIRQKIGREPL